jgi:voltage-gated potassium channel Kch
MSKGTPALIAGLAGVTGVVIILISLVVWIFNFLPAESGDQSAPYLTIIWMSLMRAIDAGTLGGDAGSLGFLVMMSLVTIFGIFIFSALIGILTAGLESKLDQLCKGKSRVVENNHTVILGWSEQVFTIISEIMISRREEKYHCITIMGEKDKVEMEEEIKQRLPGQRNIRIVCRQGNPMDMHDLAITNFNAAAVIIVVMPDLSANPDVDVIKSVLAITNNPQRKTEPYNIVAQIKDPQNLQVAEIVGQGEAEFILTGDLIARVMAQTCLQPGLSSVYTELLDFDGVEIYFYSEAGLAGKSFQEILPLYNENTVIGISSGSEVKVNPPMDYIVQQGDQLIIIAEDDSKIKINPTTAAAQSELIVSRDRRTVATTTENTLILGWNWQVERVIEELSNYLGKGATISVISMQDEAAECLATMVKDQDANVTISFIRGDTTDRALLDTEMAKDYAHLIVVCEEDVDAQTSDARTLVTLLHLRDISRKTGRKFSIVSEMLDIKNSELAKVAKVNDFIVSNKLVSLLIAQISGNRKLNAVFAEIFDADGSEIYLKSISDYVKTGVPVNFNTLTQVAASRGELAIGYKIEQPVTGCGDAFGVTISPAKDAAVVFAPEDRLVVLANE